MTSNPDVQIRLIEMQNGLGQIVWWPEVDGARLVHSYGGYEWRHYFNGCEPKVFRSRRRALRMAKHEQRFILAGRLEERTQ